MDARDVIAADSRERVVEAMARAWWQVRGFVGEWGNAVFADQQDRVRKQMRRVLTDGLAALAADGYVIVRREQVGWLDKHGGIHHTGTVVRSVQPDDRPVYVDVIEGDA